MEAKNQIIIVGAGLTGLTLAYYLKKKNIRAQLIEARNRIGGRILSLQSQENATVEMGATWLGDQHIALKNLLKEIHVDIFPQVLGETAFYEPISTSPPQIVKLPPNDAPSYRIKNGTASIVNALKDFLDEDQILLNKKLTSIHGHGEKLIAKCKDEEFECFQIVSTLPPALFFKNISVIPNLPSQLIQVGSETQTWMADSIKIALRFKKPFWKEHPKSGTIFSAVGPVPELYDHSDEENEKFALMGFINGSYFSISKEERLQLILTQLQKYYGDDVMEYESYEELVWKHEEETTTAYSKHILPHENNGHALLQGSYLDDRLFFSGTETSPSFGGYMEGAVLSALRTLMQIKS